MLLLYKQQENVWASVTINDTFWRKHICVRLAFYSPYKNSCTICITYCITFINRPVGKYFVKAPTPERLTMIHCTHAWRSQVKSARVTLDSVRSTLKVWFGQKWQFLHRWQGFLPANPHFWAWVLFVSHVIQLVKMHLHRTWRRIEHPTRVEPEGNDKGGCWVINSAYAYAHITYLVHPVNREDRGGRTGWREPYTSQSLEPESDRIEPEKNKIDDFFSTSTLYIAFQNPKHFQHTRLSSPPPKNDDKTTMPRITYNFTYFYIIYGNLSRGSCLSVNVYHTPNMSNFLTLFFEEGLLLLLGLPPHPVVHAEAGTK